MSAPLVVWQRAMRAAPVPAYAQVADLQETPVSRRAIAGLSICT